ncbi:hypothetical protein ACGK9U_03625 [Mariniflexile sp. HNIBRBA6329]|uniref:hypothetical protein n=1 Tax=Mariniflexile sp. HNIBRBA6329 TaxID=3373088 RepID=UPI00374749DF
MSVLAHVEKVYSLEGTIDNREIIMEIRNVEGYYSGRYCFRDKKKSIYLQVEYDSIAFTFNLLRSNLKTKNQESFEQIVITEDSLHNWFGEQRTPDGKIHQVFLRPIKINQSEPHSIKNEKIKEKLSPYNYCLLSDIKYESTSIQKLKKGIKIEWLTETGSKIKLFRVVEGFSESRMVKINNYLEQFYINDILNGYSYENFENEINISYFTPNILSMVESTKSYTSNTKENTSVMYLTLDLKTLKKLNLEDLLWLGEGTPPRNESREYFKYRGEVFEKKIEKYIHSSYAKEINNSKCDYSNEKTFRFPDFYLSKKGIVLMLNHYKLSDECKKQTWAVLRYNDFPNKWNEEYFNKK